MSKKVFLFIAIILALIIGTFVFWKVSQKFINPSYCGIDSGTGHSSCPVVPHLKEPPKVSETPTLTPTKEAVDSPAASNNVKNKITHTVVIDPGHQGPNIDMSALEPIGPNATAMKALCTSGTSGVATKKGEYQLNLEISLLLRDILQKDGYKVILTRENNDTAISNKERAQIATKVGGDIFVRIHANGNNNPHVYGALAMSPSQSNRFVPQLFSDSNKLSSCIINSYCKKTGFNNLVVIYTDSMSGINWSTIPVTIVEMGFMSNPDEDRKMSEPSFQPIMAQGIADGINEYFKEKDEALTSLFSNIDNKNKALYEQIINSSPIAKDNFSLSVYNLQNNKGFDFNNHKMQADSLIKLFILGTFLKDSTATNNSQLLTNELCTNMITFSDNEAANKLIEIIGDGDANVGKAKINDFCKKMGFKDTEINRLLLQGKENGDNFTSTNDCVNFLKEVYLGKNKQSEIPFFNENGNYIFDLLSKQQRKNKIPRLIPTNVVIANKTGELFDVENDVAIVMDKAPFIVAFMGENLKSPGAFADYIANSSLTLYNSFNDK